LKINLEGMMPLFQRKNDTLDMIKPGKFASEKELQSLVESNLEEMFSCRFIDTEYSTGQVLAGRMQPEVSLGILTAQVDYV
jgi:hypothetical protein